MRIGTRLIVSSILAIILIMGAFGYYRIEERKRNLKESLEKEVQILSKALQLVFEDAIREKQLAGIQKLIDIIGGYGNVLRVNVFDVEQKLILVSDSDEVYKTNDPRWIIPQETLLSLNTVFSGKSMGFFRDEKDGRQSYHYIVPLRNAQGEITGAFEILYDSSFMKKETWAAQERIFFNFLLLVVLITAIIWYSTWKNITLPIRFLIERVKAIGQGELDRKIEVRRNDEIGLLSESFNRMAENLKLANETIVEETQKKIEMERQLRHSEKLAAIGQLASGFAHEIGNPLNIVEGRATYLIQKKPQGDLLERNLKIIVDQIGKITRIVQQLLVFARKNPPSFASFDVNKRLKDVIEFIEPQATYQHITISMNLDKTLPLILGDTDQLHQVFLNLCLNAIQAMPLGGVLTVATEVVREKERNGKPFSIKVSVSDNGHGISEEEIGRIFEPFFTTKEPGEGTGLGLSISYRIIEDHGGKIEVKSQKGKGTTMEVSLPVHVSE